MVGSHKYGVIANAHLSVVVSAPAALGTISERASITAHSMRSRLLWSAVNWVEVILTAVSIWVRTSLPLMAIGDQSSIAHVALVIPASSSSSPALQYIA